MKGYPVRNKDRDVIFTVRSQERSALYAIDYPSAYFSGVVSDAIIMTESPLRLLIFAVGGKEELERFLRATK